jgi:predicted Zn-dependent protease
MLLVNSGDHRHRGQSFGRFTVDDSKIRKDCLSNVAEWLRWARVVGMRCALPWIACLAIACGPKIVNDRSSAAADLSKHLPATLEASRPREGDAKTIHVRIWVDAGMRATPKWREEIIDQADYASQLLAPLAGMRIAIDKISEWNRTTDPHASLAALAEVDKGEGVTWVIGYVTPGDVASKAMSELGFAEPLGKHVIVRGWSEKAETTALTMLLPDLKEAEKAEVISAHRRHKQSVVLLHMLAVTLGAIDEADPTWIQNPTYSPKQVGFSDRNRELLQIALDDRNAEGTEQTQAKKLLEAIEKSEFGGWLPPSKEEVTKRLRIAVDAGKSGRTAKAVPVAAYDQFSRIQTLAKQGKGKDALVELDNLLIAYPGNAAMHQLRCEILLALGGPAAAAAAKAVPKNPKAPKQPPPPPVDWKGACAKASEAAPGDPTPHVAIANSYAQIKDWKAARAELALAETKIGNLPLKAEIDDAWRKVIALYNGMGSMTWTEEALAKSKLENEPVAAEISQKRARYGVPQGAKFVAPEQEGQLVFAVRAALDLVYASKYADAERALAAVEKQWPGAPGAAATRCDLHLRTGQLDAARAQCAKAIAAHPRNSWALYLSGVIALKPGSDAGTKQGIDQLKKAIAADPDLGQAWRTLAKAYARTKDKPALEQLAKDYQAKFGQALPP